MSPDAQRVAIAEACGWKKAEPPNTPVWWKNGEWVSNVYDLPDYPNDLNAMHEAERVLEYWSGRWIGEGSWAPEAYMNHLQDIAEGDDWRFCCATAAQRAEAFLRTIAKWEDA